jgi:hypothetical protein
MRTNIKLTNISFNDLLFSATTIKKSSQPQSSTFNQMLAQPNARVFSPAAQSTTWGWQS